MGHKGLWVSYKYTALSYYSMIYKWWKIGTYWFNGDSLFHLGITIWWFPKMGVPPNRWFLRENPNLKWMIWGYSYFRKRPYIHDIIHDIDDIWILWYDDIMMHLIRMFIISNGNITMNMIYIGIWSS